MCDNCLSVDAEIENLTEEAQKFLSCVVRTGESHSEYYVTDVLLGSETDEVLANNHQDLSTFGIAGEWGREQWIQLSRLLVNQNYVEKHESGEITLKEDAHTVLEGNEMVYGLLDRSSAVVDRDAAARTSSEVEDKHDEELFTLLRDKRKEIADLNSIAPYAIFPDTTLMEMAYYFPQSRESLLKIYGVGGAKMKNFGKEFGNVVIEYAEEHDIEERTDLLEEKSKSKYEGELHERIGQAFNDGQSIEHLAEEKGVKPGSIVRQLKKYFDDGHDLRAEGIPAAADLSRRKQDEVLEAFDDKGARMLRAVYDDLNKSVDYNQLRIMQLYYQAKQK